MQRVYQQDLSFVRVFSGERLRGGNLNLSVEIKRCEYEEISLSCARVWGVRGVYCMCVCFVRERDGLQKSQEKSLWFSLTHDAVYCSVREVIIETYYFNFVQFETDDEV